MGRIHLSTSLLFVFFSVGNTYHTIFDAFLFHNRNADKTHSDLPFRAHAQTMTKIDYLERKMLQLQNRTSAYIGENRLLIEGEIQHTKRELIVEMGNLKNSFVGALGAVKGRMMNQYKLLKEKVVPKLDGIFAKVSSVGNAVQGMYVKSINK